MAIANELKIKRESCVDGKLDFERRVGTVVQLHGVLSVRIVAWRAPADREPLSDLGGHPHRRRTFRPVDLAGIKVGLMMDLPGIMSRGNWTAALFVDEDASVQAVKGLTRIFTGRVGGTTHLLSILVGQFLGVHQVPITYETQGETRIIRIENMLMARSPSPGQGSGKNVVIHNSEYWIGSDIIVSRADRSRFRGFGRNWNLAGRSAEIVKLDWGNC